MERVSQLIHLAKARKLPMVFDADGLFLINEDPTQTVMDLITGDEGIILTPNAIEFGRLYKKVFNTIPDPENMIGNVKELCQKMGNLTIVLKGAYDIISNGKEVIKAALADVVVKVTYFPALW